MVDKSNNIMLKVQAQQEKIITVMRETDKKLEFIINTMPSCKEALAMSLPQYTPAQVAANKAHIACLLFLRVPLLATLLRHIGWLTFPRGLLDSGTASPGASGELQFANTNINELYNRSDGDARVAGEEDVTIVSDGRSEPSSKKPSSKRLRSNQS
jgi:hypothetical protein